MTKTLTEQWREGTLPDGHYYTRKVCYPETYPSCDEHIVESIDLYDCGFDDDEDICEVLAPVPSYDKVKEMSQKIERLEFDNEALEMAHNEGKEINAELVSKTDELMQKMHILEKRLEVSEKEHYRTLEQLRIATKALEQYANCKPTEWMSCVTADKALKEIKEVK